MPLLPFDSSPPGLSGIGVPTTRVKRILVVPHDLNHLGGGSCVAAWALQALVARHEVSVLSWEPADVQRTNRHFGTRLEQDAFRWHVINPTVARALSLAPVPLAHLRNQILYRKARQLNATERFDAVIGLMNEIDIGVPTIQYIHYPWAFWPRPEYDLRWYHFLPLVVQYRRAAAALSGYDERRVARNVTLANSDWTAALFQQFYGTPARTVYPPVPGGFPEIPFAERARAFACVGRISPEKRIEEIIRILAGVRARGHDIRLQIIGRKDSASYARRILAIAAENKAWVSVHHDVTRSELVELVAHNRYAIHGMAEEHFGIAPAELQRAGCITFVANGGGAPEIVGRDPRVVYDSIPDAVDKIDRVLADPRLESALHRDVEARRRLFTEERFMREFADVVDSFLAA